LPAAKDHWISEREREREKVYERGAYNVDKRTRLAATILAQLINKSSAAAEMGDRGHNRHGKKLGGRGCAFFWG